MNTIEKARVTSWKLHQYPDAIDNALERAVNPDTGEIIDDGWLSELLSLQANQSLDVLDLATAFVSLEAEAEKIRNAEKMLAARRHRIEKFADGIKGIVAEIADGKKIANEIVQIGWRKSTATVVNCEATDLPPEFQNVKVTANVSAIKDAIKAGATVAGCQLVERNNVQIR